jgi:hypothetical protein
MELFLCDVKNAYGWLGVKLDVNPYVFNKKINTIFFSFL